MNLKTHALVATALLIANAGVAGEATFTTKPTASKANGKTKITFAVSSPTDVEVSILDAKGKIVRHLAAGVLGGKNPPPAPLKPGLKQELEWDGKDDRGRPVLSERSESKGPFKVQVRLGVGVEFDGFFGENKLYAEDLLGLSADAKGNFHVLSGRGGHAAVLNMRSFSLSDGSYVRELIPIPATTDTSKLSPKLFAPVPGGHPHPENFNSNLPCFLPLFNGPHVYKPLYMSINTDSKGYIHIKRFKLHYGVHCQTGAVVINPADDPKLLWPGQCRDAKGNKLVCSGKEDTVKILSASGQEIGRIKVPSPSRVAVNPKSGCIYVLSITNSKRAYQGWTASRKLYKFSPDGKQLASLDLPRKGLGGLMVMGGTKDKPILWIAVGICRGKKWKMTVLKLTTLLRIEDDGKKLSMTEHEVRFGGKRLDYVSRLAVHPETDDVVARGLAGETATFKGLTGEKKKVPFKDCTDMAVGLDGNWYVQTRFHFTGPIERYDRNWKPLPVPGRSGKAPVVTGQVQARYGSGFGMFGFDVDHQGRIFSLQQPHWKTFTGFFMAVIGPDGKAEEHPRMKDNKFLVARKDIKSALWGPTSVYVGGVGVDWKGNVYLGAKARPKSHKPPPGFEKSRSYRNLVGSVVKVNPAGGSALMAKSPPAGKKGLMAYKYYYKAGDVFLEGATKLYPGLGIMAGAPGLGPSSCCCRQPMFDVDPWGRIWMPNAATYSVQLVDNEGNRIIKFGKYGNADSRGDNDKSPIRKPKIPFGWPEAVGVSYKAVYVADVANRRVVRLTKTYAADESCAIK
jgi:hypothetical protein